MKLLHTLFLLHFEVRNVEYNVEKKKQVLTYKIKIYFSYSLSSEVLLTEVEISAFSKVRCSRFFLIALRVSYIALRA